MGHAIAVAIRSRRLPARVTEPSCLYRGVERYVVRKQRSTRSAVSNHAVTAGNVHRHRRLVNGVVTARRLLSNRDRSDGTGVRWTKSASPSQPVPSERRGFRDIGTSAQSLGVLADCFGPLRDARSSRSRRSACRTGQELNRPCGRQRPRGFVRQGRLGACRRTSRPRSALHYRAIGHEVRGNRAALKLGAEAGSRGQISFAGKMRRMERRV